MTKPKTKLGGTAFPTRSGEFYYYGMTLRDWFAGQVLAGFLSSLGREERLSRSVSRAEVLAEQCYKIADAMLGEKEKGEKR